MRKVIQLFFIFLIFSFILVDNSNAQEWKDIYNTYITDCATLVSQGYTPYGKIINLGNDNFRLDLYKGSSCVSGQTLLGSAQLNCYWRQSAAPCLGCPDPPVSCQHMYVWVYFYSGGYTYEVGAPTWYQCSCGGDFNLQVSGFTSKTVWPVSPAYMDSVSSAYIQANTFTACNGEQYYGAGFDPTQIHFYASKDEYDCLKNRVLYKSYSFTVPVACDADHINQYEVSVDLTGSKTGNNVIALDCNSPCVDNLPGWRRMTNAETTSWFSGSGSDSWSFNPVQLPDGSCKVMMTKDDAGAFLDQTGGDFDVSTSSGATQPTKQGFSNLTANPPPVFNNNTSHSTQTFKNITAFLSGGFGNITSGIHQRTFNMSTSISGMFPNDAEYTQNVTADRVAKLQSIWTKLQNCFPLNIISEFNMVLSQATGVGFEIRPSMPFVFWGVTIDPVAKMCDLLDPVLPVFKAFIILALTFGYYKLVMKSINDGGSL